MSADPTTVTYEVKRPTQGPAKFDWHIRQRYLVLGLALVGAGLFAASWFQPYWNFMLFAPQYPDGLKLVIALNGVTGDTAEINIINHYIGMGHLEDGAVLEKALGGYLIAALAVVVTVVTLFIGKRLNWLAAVGAAGLPLGFIGDTMYWLYHFGHVLDPKAAIHIAPFTPAMFGTGKVGQFVTEAWPGVGFWMAIAGVAAVVVASVLRQRVCNDCPKREHCEALCSHGLVGVKPHAHAG